MIPWAVNQLEDFLYFCCPECDFKEKDSDDFLDHALINHPDSKVHLSEFFPKSIDLQQTFKKEKSTESSDIGKDCIKLEAIKDSEDSEPEVIAEELDNSVNFEPEMILDEVKPLKEFNCTVKLEKLTEKEIDSAVNEKWICEKCKRDDFKSKSGLVQHFNKCNGPDGYKCDICPRKFNLMSKLFLHKQNDHTTEEKQVKHICTICNKVFKKLRGLKEHMQFIHVDAKEKIRFVCKHCGKGFAWKKSFKYHENKCQSDGEQFNCDKCNFVALGKVTLRRHNKQFHGIGDYESFPCEFCGGIYSNSKSLDIHQKERHISDFILATIPCNCQKCKQQFNKAKELNEHLQNCLNISEKNNLTCCFCKSENWLSEVALVRHAAEEHRSFLHVCKICNVVLKGRKNPSHLEKHLSKEKNECGICLKTFNNKLKLKHHMFKIHGDESISHHTCEYCNKKFIRLDKLEEHLNIFHTQKEKFKCPDCDFTTLRKSYVVTHQRIVHEKRIICTCPYGCGKEFTKKGSVYHSHIKRCDQKLMV